ncbi:MAG: hypothetical protein HRT61_09455 [Ekhidna sp.]|nr:hypothetical protein [Ekhidna sp.]
MEKIITFTFFLTSTLNSSFVQWPKTDINWYSEYSGNGIRIQNSFPKGGPYPKPIDGLYHCSQLVFFSRIVNESEDTVTVRLDFSNERFPVPNSENLFVQFLLPSATMAIEKENQFNYGLMDFDPLRSNTKQKKTLSPNETHLQYVVAFFYQTDKNSWIQERGGNRAELVTQGNKLYYKMLPQVDSLLVGDIMIKR